MKYQIENIQALVKLNGFKSEFEHYHQDVRFEECPETGNEIEIEHGLLVKRSILNDLTIEFICFYEKRDNEIIPLYDANVDQIWNAKIRNEEYNLDSLISDDVLVMPSHFSEIK